MFCIFSCMALCCQLSQAQIVWGPWILVPISECSDCDLPIDTDPDCDPGPILLCYRSDGKNIMYPGFGVAAIKWGPTISCVYCPGCCEDCSCDPEMLYSIACGTSTATVAETFAFPWIAPNLSTASAATVGANLVTCVGYSGATCTSTCTASANLCQNTKTTAFLLYITGEQCRYEHEWSAAGVWGSGTQCPITGNWWFSSSCPTDFSSIVADICSSPLPNSLCTKTFLYCGPLCP